MQSGVTNNLQTWDVNMYVLACETDRLYHIKKDVFANGLTVDMVLLCR